MKRQVQGWVNIPIPGRPKGTDPILKRVKKNRVVINVIFKDYFDVLILGDIRVKGFHV
jgi:hypothetical protein